MAIVVNVANALTETELRDVFSGREAPPPASFKLFGWIQSEAGQAVVGERFTPLP